MNRNIQKILTMFFVLQLFSCSTEVSAQVGGISGDSTEQESILGPWLNLTEGGYAVGPTQVATITNADGSKTELYGSLSNGTLLPQAGTGFMRRSGPNTSWGAGIMISLIENSAAHFQQNYYPDITIYIGDIAQEHGGKYSPHSSHQSGLDADFYFVGNKKYQSMLDANGNVTNLFDPVKNWQYWRLLVAQQILEKGKPVSAVSMILVAPEIKNYLCEWTKANNMRQDPLDLEVLKRLRPTAGHDDHFHLRVRCSPYYADCRREGNFSGSASTGCAD